MERPAQLIHTLRTDRGLTQAQACRLAGVSRATWSTLESGATTNPRAATKVRVARALGVTPSRIWHARPLPLHLDEVEDPRWEGAVVSLARRLLREGSRQERRRFGEQLAAVSSTADRGDAGDGRRWQQLWELAGALALDAHTLPIAIIDGRLVESEQYSLTTPSVRRSPAARVRRAHASANRTRRR
jgi:transcriptional regulator with XRE-family HTH domain